MYIIGYEYESSCGTLIRKAVICETYDEFVRVRERIRNAKGYKMVEFDDVISSKMIPN